MYVQHTVGSTQRVWSVALVLYIQLPLSIISTKVCIMYTVEPPIKDTPNKEHLSIKDKSTRPNSYYTSIF